MKVLVVVFALLVACDAGKPGLRGDSCHDMAAGFAAFLQQVEKVNDTVSPYDIPDPSCKEGVVSPDLKVCCADECGSCGNHKLCDEVGKYHEQTGKLADNCCRDRIKKKAPSCDKTHPPCVLSPDYAKELDTYKIDRPKRHAMDDCNKAMDIAREKQGLGIEKGEFLTKLYLKGTTKYEEARDIAIKVGALCEKKILELYAEENPIKDKMDKATEADKKVDPMTGTSKYNMWLEQLESNDNQIIFYREIIKNAKRVKGEAKDGVGKVNELKAKVYPVRDIEPYRMKLDGLVVDAEEVYREAELLWKQWLDSGKDYDCGAPPAVEHAATQCKDGNTKYAFNCQIKCANGYDSNASKNELKCLKQGKFGKKLYGEWQGMASCVGVDCGVPPEIEHAKSGLQAIRYPNIANYHCHEGYATDDKVTSPKAFSIPCGSTGNYMKNHSHQCVKIKCGPAPGFPDTEPVPGVFYYADVVNYKCLKGYTLDEQPGGISNFSEACSAHGKITTTKNCQRVRCGPPPDFTHTIEKAKPTEKYYGDKVSFECRPGYSLDQQPSGPKDFTLECGANGEFYVEGAGSDVKLPKCQAVSAGMSPKIGHGNLPSREMFYGQEAWVSADDGYSYLSKPSEGLTFQLTVTTEGTYAGVEEFKPVECGPPPTITKAVPGFKTSMAVFGDVLPYTCEVGYSTDATDHKAALSFALMCESDGDLSKVPDRGECVNIDDCLQHTCGPHGECVDELQDYKCSCDSGYEQTVDADSGEKLCGNINDCGPEACGVGKCKDLVNAYECICPEGYEEIGDGAYDKTCAAKTCGIPPQVDNAATSPLEDGHAKAFYPNEILYQCELGYTTDGKPGGKNHFKTRCLSDTTFAQSGEVTCNPIQCGPAPSVNKSSSTPAETTFNQTIEYKCEEGYTIDGTSAGDNHFKVACQENGEYTDVLECLPVTCGHPMELANANVEAGQVFFPQKRSYSCFEGFTLDGKTDSGKSFEIECQANGKLTKAKQCMAVVCGEPPKHINALFATAADEGPVSYPQITEVTCRDGYSVGGDPQGEKSYGVQCLTTGKFAKIKAECEPVRCGGAPEFENAQLDGPIGKHLNYEETATYACLPGFTAGGEHDAKTSFLVECLASGETSSPAPDMQCRDVDACEQHTCGPKGNCIDTVGVSIDAYSCNCSYGYEVQMVKGEQYCGNIDDCGKHECGVGTCVDKIADYTCNCPTGYYIGMLDNEKTCVPVRCSSEPPVLKDGKMLTSHTGPVDFPLSLRFECNEGYSTDGSVGDAKRKFHANCKADGTLYGMATCRAVSCGTPRILPFTTISGSPGPTDSVDYGQKVTYKCIDGYYIGGVVSDSKKEFVTDCLKTGLLADPAVCDPVSCGAAPHLPHAHPHIEPEVFYGMQLEYFCDYGYTSDGTTDGSYKFPRRCLANGQFEVLTNKDPCKPLSAGVLPDIPNAKISEYGGVNAGELHLPITAYYPDSAEYHCLPGFTLTGGADGQTKFVTTVTAEGTLDPLLPEKCLPIVYYARGKIKNARNGAGLTGATVSIVGTSISATSSTGFFALTNVPPGIYEIKFEMNGYIAVERRITITRNINVGGAMDVSMSPSMADDQWRAVLKWNAQPTDLDTYAQWGYSKVCWYGRSKAGGNMQGTLEKDDTDGYGPETLFLNNVGKCRGSSQACDIAYRINDYTRSQTMAEKGASVTLYSGSRVVGSWDISECRTSVSDDKNWWHVFTIDGRTNQLKWNCKAPPEIPVEPGIMEEVFYFNQGYALDNVPNLNSRKPDLTRVAYQINYPTTGNRWPGLTQATNFAVRWEGSVRITTRGTYTFYLTSDDGSKMWIDEDLVINNGGLHGFQQKSGTISLPSDLHAIRVDFFQHEGGAGCVFKYTGPDTGNQVKVVGQSVLRINPVLGGLTEEAFYYDQNIGSLPDLRTQTPNLAREVDYVNYAPTEELWPGFARTDNYAVRWTGFVVIHIAGEYTFTITSDDGSMLWLKDEELINNGGRHGMTAKSGSITLTTDFHRIRFEYFENDGGAGAKLEYKGADSNNEQVVIPMANLRKPAGEPFVINVNAGLKESVFAFGQNPANGGDLTYNMPLYSGRVPDMAGVVSFVNHDETSSNWGGYSWGEYYAVRWSGSIVSKRSGTYTIQIGSDDGSMLWWEARSEPLINNGGIHGFQSKSAQVSMTGGTPYAITFDYYQNQGSRGAKLSYSGADTDDQMKIVPRRALLKTSPLTGLLLEGFYLPGFQGGSLNDFDNVNSMPNVRALVSTVNWEESTNRWTNFITPINFAVRFTGSVVIHHAGTYAFWIGSDDGSKLYMGQSYETLIDNDGLHGYQEAEGSKELIEGETPLMIRYFNHDGGNSMRFFWQGQDSNNQKEIVPAENMRRIAGTVATPSLDCECFHCGNDNPFPDANICGAASDVCGPNSPNNGGCWTNRDENCVCATQQIRSRCACYHCGNTNPFPEADVCGGISGECGPYSAGNSGCWTEVSDGACQCDEGQTVSYGLNLHARRNHTQNHTASHLRKTH